MNEQAVIAEFQRMVQSGMSPAQAAMKLAPLVPEQLRQKLQQLAGGQPGTPAQGAVTPPLDPGRGQAAGPQPTAYEPRTLPPTAAPPASPGPAGPAGALGGAPQGAPNTPQKPPGYYRAAPAGPEDKYGGTMRANSNAPGVQSNGDDDPWSIGAARGTTYDPETLMRWHQRAQQGDGKAAWVLRQVGFYDEQNRPAFGGSDGMEQWANSRSLDRRAAQGSATPWYHDPTNWGGKQGFTGAEDADTAFKAAPWGQLYDPNDRPSSYPGGKGQAPVAQPQASPQSIPGQDLSPERLGSAFGNRGTGRDEGMVGIKNPFPLSDGPGSAQVDPAVDARKDPSPKLQSIDDEIKRRWYGR